MGVYVIDDRDWIAFEEGFVRAMKHISCLCNVILRAHKEELQYRKLHWKEELNGIKERKRKK